LGNAHRKIVKANLNPLLQMAVQSQRGSLVVNARNSGELPVGV
jgi:hypothetical protein